VEGELMLAVEVHCLTCLWEWPTEPGSHRNQLETLKALVCLLAAKSYKREALRLARWFGRSFSKGSAQPLPTHMLSSRQ
jgi:hypothetical protein